MFNRAPPHERTTGHVPTYEYRCAHCDRTFDVVQSFHDDPLTECPTCGKPVRKVFGNVGIVLKGSGFYKTDSRKTGSNGSGPKTKSSSGDTASEKGTAASSTGSSEPAASSAAASTGTDKGTSAG